MHKYNTSSFRFFNPGEKHVTRLSREDVLLLVFSGVLRFSENGNAVEVSEGEYYIQKADMYQEGVVPSDSPKYFYIHFNGQYSDQNGLPLRGNFSYEAIKPLLFRLEKLEMSQKPILEKTTLFYQILVNLCGVTNNEISAVQEIEQYLSENYLKEITISGLAGRFNYSEDYIIRIFKKAYGVTPYQYMINLRMQLAKQLLLSTNRSIVQISEECGYQDFSAFYRAFSKMFGCSPAKWRQKQIMMPGS